MVLAGYYKYAIGSVRPRTAPLRLRAVARMYESLWLWFAGVLATLATALAIFAL